jgi:cobaltochelatase CobS
MPYDPDLIVTLENIHIVRAWAIEAGYPAVQVNAMGAVDLANLYHAQAGADSPTDAQRAAARAVCDTLAALAPGAGLTVDMVRAICREEFEKIPPRRLMIEGPQGNVILNGPLHYRTELVIKIVSMGHHTMLVGPAGCGKTTIGQHVAQALQLPFYITSTINDTHELTGFVDGYGKYHDTPFRNAYENGGLWVADEIDAWDASALLAANSALANGFATFPDMATPLPRHADFRVIATANTYGIGADRVYIGRNELDAASLDRFAVLDVDYDLTLERLFCNGNDRWLDRVWQVRRRVQEKRIRHVVSSRAIAMGAPALANGILWDDVEEIYLFKGMSENDREKIDG